MYYVSRTAFVLCQRTGGPQEPQDISWPSSPIGTVSCTACVLCHRTGGPKGAQEPQDISWPSSPIGTVSCTAFVLSHRTGGPPDISWPSSPIGTVICTAIVLCHRTGGPQEPEDIAGRPRLGRSAVLHLYSVIGRAGCRSRRTSLAVVACRDGQLYCNGTMS